MNNNISLVLVIKNIDGGTGTFLRQMLGIGKPVKTVSVIALEEPTFHAFDVTNIVYCRDKDHKKEPGGRTDAAQILLKEFLFLARQLGRMNPDVIIAIDAHCSLLVCLVRLIVGIRSRLLLTFHNSISGVFTYKHYLFPPWLIRLSGWLLFRLSDGLIGVSKGVTGDVIKNFRPSVPVHTIYYGLDPMPIKRSLQQLTKHDRRLFSNNVPFLVTVSRLAGQKDIRTLLAAGRILLEKNIGYRLLIIGDGKERSEYKQMIRRNHMDGNVFLLGWKRNIYPYLGKSDIFVLSTHYEGFPFVLLEAMRMGLPVVATNVSFGPAELLGDSRYGLLVRPADPVDLARKLEKLIQSKMLRKKYHGASLARIRNFSKVHMLRQYRQVIQLVLHEDRK